MWSGRLLRSAGVAARLDGAPARRIVAQHGGRLRLLRLLVSLRIARRRLGRVQRGRWCRRRRRHGGRGGRFSRLLLLGRLLLGLASFAILLFLDLGGLQLGELLLAARLLLS